MKIWQAWSSSHSVSFAIYGTFEDELAAWRAVHLLHLIGGLNKEGRPKAEIAAVFKEIGMDDLVTDFQDSQFSLEGYSADGFDVEGIYAQGTVGVRIRCGEYPYRSSNEGIQESLTRILQSLGAVHTEIREH